MNSYDYITEVKRTNHLDTDYKVAKMLGCGQNKITQYKNGQTMDNNTARQIAEILAVPVWNIIADMEAQRAKDEPTRKAWRVLSKMSKESGAIAPNLLIAMPLFLFSALQCILCKIARKQKTFPKVNNNYLMA